MATIITKNSSTASSVPTNAQLVQGELAVNVTDKRLFTENASGTVVELGTNPSSLTLSNGTANGLAFLNASKVLTTGSALQFDGSNLGLGVTPSAWSSIDKAFEIGRAGNGMFSGGIDDLTLSANAYYQSGWKYGSTGFANRFNVGSANGSFQWYTAPSGTAGNAISFTQAMTLDASGNLLLGTTSGSYAITARRAPAASSNQIMLEAFRTTGANSGVGDYLSTANGLYGQKYIGSSWFGSLIGTNGIVFNTGSLGSETERARIDSSGNLLVGTTSAGGQAGLSILPNNSNGAATLFWDRASTSSTSTALNFENGNATVGSVTYTNTGTAYNTSSDYRLKEDIAPMTGALAKVAQLKPCTYKWKADGSDGEGFIAHELAEVVPQCVTGEKDAVDADGNPVYQGIDTSFLVATLTAAIQELKAELDSVKSELASLKGN